MNVLTYECVKVFLHTPRLTTDPSKNIPRHFVAPL